MYGSPSHYQGQQWTMPWNPYGQFQQQQSPWQNQPPQQTNYTSFQQQQFLPTQLNKMRKAAVDFGKNHLTLTISVVCAIIVLIGGFAFYKHHKRKSEEVERNTIIRYKTRRILLEAEEEQKLAHSDDYADKLNNDKKSTSLKPSIFKDRPNILLMIVMPPATICIPSDTIPDPYQPITDTLCTIFRYAKWPSSVRVIVEHYLPEIGGTSSCDISRLYRHKCRMQSEPFVFVSQIECHHVAHDEWFGTTPALCSAMQYAQSRGYTSADQYGICGFLEYGALVCHHWDVHVMQQLVAAYGDMNSQTSKSPTRGVSFMLRNGDTKKSKFNWKHVLVKKENETYPILTQPLMPLTQVLQLRAQANYRLQAIYKNHTSAQKDAALLAHGAIDDDDMNSTHKRVGDEKSLNLSFSMFQSEKLLTEKKRAEARRMWLQEETARRLVPGTFVRPSIEWFTELIMARHSRKSGNMRGSIPHHDYYENISTFHIPLVDLMPPLSTGNDIGTAFPSPIPTPWFDSRCAFFPSHAVAVMLRSNSITRHVGNLDKGADFLAGVHLWQERYEMFNPTMTFAAADQRIRLVGAGKATPLWVEHYIENHRSIMPNSLTAAKHFLIPLNWTSTVKKRMDLFKTKFGIDLHTHWLSPHLSWDAWLGVANGPTDKEISYKYESRTKYEALLKKFESMLKDLESSLESGDADFVEAEEDDEMHQLLVDLGLLYEQEQQ